MCALDCYYFTRGNGENFRRNRTRAVIKVVDDIAVVVRIEKRVVAEHFVAQRRSTCCAHIVRVCVAHFSVYVNVLPAIGQLAVQFHTIDEFQSARIGQHALNSQRRRFASVAPHACAQVDAELVTNGHYVGPDTKISLLRTLSNRTRHTL